MEKTSFLEIERKILKENEIENNREVYKQAKKETYFKIIEDLKLQINELKNAKNLELNKNEQLSQEYDQLSESYSQVKIQ
jgi:hypothetical protein